MKKEPAMNKSDCDPTQESPAGSAISSPVAANAERIARALFPTEVDPVAALHAVAAAIHTVAGQRIIYSTIGTGHTFSLEELIAHPDKARPDYERQED